MERLLAIMLLMSLLTVACNKSGDGSSEEAPATPTTSKVDTATGSPDTGSTDDGSSPDLGPVVPDGNVPTQALTFGTNVSYLEGFDTLGEDKYNQAVALVKEVVATEAFRDAVLNHTFNGSKTYANNNGLSNAQIYQSILDAAERLTPVKNNVLDVGVKLYYENSNVVGYTSSNITYINVNTKYFDTYAINSVAGNLFHEWLHKLGYGHDSAATAARPYSVPYAVGYMIRDIGKNFL